MAFWIKKKNEENTADADESSSLKPKKKKDEKKENKPRRIDNMRIPQQLRITLRSLGSPNEYAFTTKDLSATGAFVLCSNITRYPFEQQSTILDACVELKEPDGHDAHDLRFLAKIARIVKAEGEGANQITGFGVRIVQINQDMRILLELFIQRHGSPDVNNAAAEQAGLLQHQTMIKFSSTASAENGEEESFLGELDDENDENKSSASLAIEMPKAV